MNLGLVLVWLLTIVLVAGGVVLIWWLPDRFNSTPDDPFRWAQLARYNAERGRGIVHSPEWDEMMRDEQAAFDLWMREDAKRRGYIILGDDR